MMGLGANFTMREVVPVPAAMLIVTMISVKAYSVLKTHRFYR